MWYKFWALASIYGCVYNYKVLGEAGKKGPPPGCNAFADCGESGFVFLCLTDHLEPNTHKLFFDNYFCSAGIVKFLASKGVWALATLKPNHPWKSPLLLEKVLKNLGHGKLHGNQDKDKSLAVTWWFDKKNVLVIPSFIGEQPLGECERFDKNLKKTTDILRPESVRVYNDYMGGVDKSDNMLALYQSKYRSRKWYHRINFHIISQCLVKESSYL